jgi:hypothetical protein
MIRPREFSAPFVQLAAVAAIAVGACLRSAVGDESAPPTIAEIPPANAPANLGAPEDASFVAVPAGQSGYQPRALGPPIQVTDADRAGHALMRRVLESLRDQENETNIYYGIGKLKADRLLYANAQTPDLKLKTTLRLMFAEMDHGHAAESLALMPEAEKLIAQAPPASLPMPAAELHHLIGVVHLRRGETENCCLSHHVDACLLPIRGGGLHTRQEGSRAAIEKFKQAVAMAPKNSKAYYEPLWLWNIAAQTINEYPESVPPEHRIAPERFQSQEDFPRFMNIARDLGLDTDSMAGSVIAEDFNNDGYLDLVVATWDVREPLKFYLNNGHGRFLDRSSEAGLDGICGGLNLLQGDYNNDGRVDIYVLRGAWLFGGGRHAGSLLRNNGDGTFTDVTFPAGLAEESYPGQAGGWADYDLDGWLDLFVAGEQGPTNRAPCRLFHNNGDGTFTDVALPAGVATFQLVKGCTWGDYNNDRYPDLFITNASGNVYLGGAAGQKTACRMYRNNQDGTFTDVATEVGVSGDNASFPTWFWDYNNDGILDLFVASYHTGLMEVAKFYRGEPVDVGMPRVYRGTKEGKFVEVTKELGLAEPTLPMGSNFGDLDNDGWLDVYLGTGSPDYQMIIPNKLFHNLGGRKFSDVSEAAGMAHLQKGHGIAFADLDADGDQDVFEQMGGALPVDKFVDALYENPGFGNNFFAVELVGVESNRMGVGSRIRLDVEDNGQARSIYKWVNSGGSFGCNSLRQQIGIGKATVVKRLEVYWPKSDTTQVFENLPANGIVRVTEGSDDLVKTGLRATEFDRPRTVAAAN